VIVTVESSGLDSDYDGIDDACDDNIITTVQVPNGFTPDNDGINDTFVIPGLDSYSTRKVSVFNRYGNAVYTNDAYSNDWNGTSSINGMELPDGTYFYVLELDNSVVKSGYVYINRVY
jgi:gliding motility-associated-like protein